MGFLSESFRGFHGEASKRGVMCRHRFLDVWRLVLEIGYKMMGGKWQVEGWGLQPFSSLDPKEFGPNRDIWLVARE